MPSEKIRPSPTLHQSPPPTPAAKLSSRLRSGRPLFTLFTHLRPRVSWMSTSDFHFFFFFLVLWICSIWEFLWELNCILTFCCYQLWEKFFPSHSEFSCELNSERKIRDFFFLVPNLSSLSPVMMDWWIFSSGFSNVWCLWRSSNVEFRLTDNISMSHFLCYAKKEGSSVWTWMTILLLDEEILCVLGFNILAQSRIGCSELFLGICQ